MAVTDDASLGPPPLSTPIVSQEPMQVGWGTWFNRLYQRMLELLAAVRGAVVIDNVTVACTTPGANSNVLTFTAGYVSTSADVGNRVAIVSGTNINPGTYRIVAQTSSTWTLKGQMNLTQSAGAGSAIQGGMVDLVLSHPGRLVKVSGPGTVCESSLSESDMAGAVQGAGNLTHANVVPKVGATPGQLVEGGITDESSGASDKVHITAAGNVGIGTSSPAYPLSLGTSLAPIKFAVYDGGGVAYGFGIESGFVDYMSGFGGGHKFYCNSSTLGVVINSSGWVGIGFAPSYQLQLSLDSAVKPSTSTWSVASDLRLKQNVEDMKDNSLAIIRGLNWIRYEYNGLAQMPRGLKGVGLIAQTLQDQLPEAVRSAKGKLAEDGEETDILAIDYHYILVHAARAIQALDAELKELRALIKPTVRNDDFGRPL